MLNLEGFRLLSDKKQVSPSEAQLFMFLMTHFDLTQYKCLSPTRLARKYGLPAARVSTRLIHMVRIGLLWKGPRVDSYKPDGALDKDGGVTYRVNPRLILDQEQFANWSREQEADRQRSQLAPLEEFQDALR